MNHKFMHVSPPHFQVGKVVGLGLQNIFVSVPAFRLSRISFFFFLFLPHSVVCPKMGGPLYTDSTVHGEEISWLLSCDSSLKFKKKYFFFWVFFKHKRLRFIL